MVGLGLALSGCAVFLLVQAATAVSMGALRPENDTIVPTSSVEIMAELEGYSPGAGEVTLFVDDIPVEQSALELAPGLVKARLSLADGRHVAKVVYLSKNAFSSRLVRRWAFVVDTTAPRIAVQSPNSKNHVASKPTMFRVELDEPGAVELWVDGALVELSQTGYGAVGEVVLPEGRREMRLRAVDRVGNEAVLSWLCFVDYYGPRIEVKNPPSSRITATSLVLDVQVSDNQPEGLYVQATLDGVPLPITDLDQPETEPNSPGTDNPNARWYRITTGEMSEGLHLLAITVSDFGRNSVTESFQFTVDSTSLFGVRPMQLGAVGNDVNMLQSILRDKGYYYGELSGYFDGMTLAAVKAYRTDRGLPAAEGVDTAMLRALVGYIVIDRSACTLTLYDENGPVKTYGCAVGMPEYPTPLGSYQIISKVRNPAWSPPPSPWAEKLEPVPPGVGNPLGTRWIGLSAPYIGIHGTYESWSIGHWASHGCIRMYIRDVEDLFERVSIGTPVDIVP